MSTTDTPFDVVVDPETGEVLAATEADRQYLIEVYADALVLEAQAVQRAREARRGLALLMRVGDAVARPGGWAVRVKPPASPRRQVIPHALEEHAEALVPIGIAPREETVTRTVYAKVSEIQAAGDALARVGLTPEQFLHTPDPGDPQIVVVPPSEEDR